jgi:succinoglycan biosynthesis protein ExoA
MRLMFAGGACGVWNLYCPEQISSEARSASGAADTVLVVVPCLNESEHIEALLGSLLNDSAGLDLLIVVADGGSTDGTQDIVARIVRNEPQIRLLHNPKRIQSAGVNLAVRDLGEGRRWLARIDAHAEYPKGYISALIAEARRMHASSVVVAMKSRGADCFQRAAAVAQNSVLGTGGAAHRRAGEEGFVDHGHHALFDLERFIAVGGYDESLSHNEDAEFDVRLARAGGRIWLTRAVDVVYFPRSHPLALYRQYVSYGRGRARTLMHHRMRPKVRQCLPACVLPTILALMLFPWIPFAVGPAFVWSACCLLSGVVLGLQQRRRCAFASGIAAMIIHLGWSIGFWWELAFGARKRTRTAPI